MDFFTGMLIDKCVLIEEVKRRDTFYSPFFEFLSNNEKTGLVTNNIINGVSDVLNYISRNDREAYRALKKFNGILTFLDHKKIDNESFSKNLDIVNKFIEERGQYLGLYKLSRDDTYSRAKRYRQIDECKQRAEDFRLEDRKVLSQAITLKPDYSSLFLVTHDKDFVSKRISDAIRETFEINCRTPKYIMSNVVPLI